AVKSASTTLWATRRSPDGWSLSSQPFASRARFRQAWVAESGWTEDLTTSPPGWTTFTNGPLAIEGPEYFETEQADVEMMTVAELRTYVQELAASGFNFTPWAVE